MMYKKIASYGLNQDDLGEVIGIFKNEVEKFAFPEDEGTVAEQVLGWVNPISGDDALYLELGGYFFVKLLVVTRKVSSAKLSREVKKREEAMLDNSPDLAITKAMRKEIAESAKLDMLADEEPVYKYFNATFDIQNKRVDVDASQANAEMLLTYFRTTIGGSGLKAIPYLSDLSMKTPASWLLDVPPSGVSMGSEYNLVFESTKVGYKKVGCDDNNLLNQLRENYSIEKASLNLDERFDIVFNKKGEITSFGICDSVNDEIDDALGEQKDAYLAMFTLMADIRAEAIPRFKDLVSGKK